MKYYVVSDIHGYYSAFQKALKESADKFAKRFTLAEKYALAGGMDVTKLSPAEWDVYYRKAKTALETGEEA